MASLSNYIDPWLTGYAKSSRSRMGAEIRRFITWCDENHVALDDVRRVHIESYKRSLIELLGLQKTTAYGYVSTVASFYRYCVDEGVIDSDPTEHVKRGTRTRYSTSRWYTATQLHDLLDASRERADPDLHALIYLLALQGFRIGETVEILIDTMTEISGKTCVLLTHRKYSPGGQYVALSQPTIDAIAPLLAKRRTGKLLRFTSRSRYKRDIHVDPHRATVNLARWRLQQFLDAEDLPPINPHGLRHTFITLARDASIPDRDIMAAVGHIDPRMLAYYDRAHSSVDRQAAISLAASLDL